MSKRRSRLKRHLQLPYGKQAVLLGLTKPPPVAEPPPNVASAIVAPVK